MPRTTSISMKVMAAGERARKLAQKVGAARRELTKLQKAQEKADADYLALVRDSLAGLEGSASAGREGTQPTAN